MSPSSHGSPLINTPLTDSLSALLSLLLNPCLPGAPPQSPPAPESLFQVCSWGTKAKTHTGQGQKSFCSFWVAIWHLGPDSTLCREKGGGGREMLRIQSGWALVGKRACSLTLGSDVPAKQRINLSGAGAHQDNRSLAPVVEGVGPARELGGGHSSPAAREASPSESPCYCADCLTQSGLSALGAQECGLADSPPRRVAGAHDTSVGEQTLFGQWQPFAPLSPAQEAQEKRSMGVGGRS